MYNVKVVSEALASIGRPPADLSRMHSFLENAGFVDIVDNTSMQPIGPWPKDKQMKDIGGLNMLLMETAIDAYTLASLTRIKGMPYEEVRKICDESWEAVKNKNQHVYMH